MRTTSEEICPRNSATTGVTVSVLRRFQFSKLRLRLNDSNTKQLPNTSILYKTSGGCHQMSIFGSQRALRSVGATVTWPGGQLALVAYAAVSRCQHRQQGGRLHPRFCSKVTHHHSGASIQVWAHNQVVRLPSMQCVMPSDILNWIKGSLWVSLLIVYIDVFQCLFILLSSMI